MTNPYDYSKILCNTPNDIRSSINMCDAQQASLNSMINACCANTEYVYANDCKHSVTDMEEDLDEGPIGLTIINCDEEDKNKMTTWDVIKLILIIIFLICLVWAIILFEIWR